MLIHATCKKKDRLEIGSIEKSSVTHFSNLFYLGTQKLLRTVRLFKKSQGLYNLRLVMQSLFIQ